MDLIRELADQITAQTDDLTDLRLRKATVVSVQSSSSVTVKVAASGTDIAGVQSLEPLAAGAVVWLLQQGPLLLALGSPGGHAHATVPGAFSGYLYRPDNSVGTTHLGTPALLNQPNPSGFYETVSNSAAPDGNWWLIYNIRHTNSGNHYASQFAFRMTGGGPDLYTRKAESGALDGSGWSAWSEVALGNGVTAGDLSASGYLYGHRDNPNGWQVRIGEIVGAAGVYAPSQAMFFYTEADRSFSWRTGNREAMFLTPQVNARLVLGGSRNYGTREWPNQVVELRDVGAPLIAFHQPGQVASSIGQVDGSEDFRTHDNGGGGYRSWTASNYFTASAMKYKTDVQPFRRDRKLLDLKPIKYRLKENPMVHPEPWDEKVRGPKPKDHKDDPPLRGSRKMRDDDTEVGFDAAEVHRVYPHLVQLDKDGTPEAVNYVGMVPMLLAEVQALRAELDALKAAATGTPPAPPVR